MTNAATAKIFAALNEVFAEMDARVLAETKVWAHGRAAAIHDFWQSDFYKANKHNSSAVYRQLFALAGGKSWYTILTGRNATMIDEFVTKNCAAIVASRNASITHKLEKAEVTEVTDSKFARTKDGYNGVFHVETNKGRKIVTIDTIYAGGYNIQCLHMRCLVKVK